MSSKVDGERSGLNLLNKDRVIAMLDSGKTSQITENIGNESLTRGKRLILLELKNWIMTVLEALDH